ncbi:MAG: hypothetical protein ACRD1K_03730 [Acidimicrobiales bacterium]
MAVEVEPTSESRTGPSAKDRGWVGLLRRITRFEVVTAAVVAVVLIGLALALAEPDVLEAPFEIARTAVFTFGGGALSALGSS